MDSDYVIHLLGKNITDAHRTSEELIRELAEARAQLSDERGHRRKLDKQISSQEELRRLAQFPGQNPNPIVRCTPQGKILYANTSALRWLATFDCQDQDLLPKTLISAVATAFGKDHPIETEISNPDGRTFNIVAVQPPGEAYANLYSIDITKRKQAQAALIESEARYRGVLDNMLEGCIMVGFNGCILYVNDVAARQSRLSKAQMLNRSVTEVFPGIEKSEFYEIARRCMQERITRQMEYEFVFHDNSKRWLKLTAQPAPEGIFLLAVDLTEQKQMEAQRLEIERRKQQIAKAESLSRMAGAVAHHFNNILAVVLGNLEMAIEDLPAEKAVVKFLISAEDAARRAVDISRLMRLFLGQSQGRSKQFDLAQTCENQLGALRGKIPKGVSLITDFPSPGPVISADPDQVNQLLTHLVTNACEAIKTITGMIWVKVGITNGEPIPKKNRFPMEWEQSAQNYACLTVADTGCGMSAETIAHIFDPFFTDKFIGRGLGLAMVIGIIKSLDGCISVVSGIGDGSTLRVYLPVVK